jgi:hypothetical protein
MKAVDAPRDTAPNKWSLPWSQRVTIDAEASSREQAEALRSRLADIEGWAVATSGADAADGRRLPNDMTLRLDRTSVAPESSP